MQLKSNPADVINRSIPISIKEHYFKEHYFNYTPSTSIKLTLQPIPCRLAGWLARWLAALLARLLARLPV